VLSLGSLTAGVLGEESHFAGGLPIFVMAGISAIASVWLREAHARATARGGLVALIAGMAVTLAALHFGSTVLFLAGAATAGLGFGPAFAGAFRSLTTRAPEDQRAAFVSSILMVAYGKRLWARPDRSRRGRPRALERAQRSAVARCRSGRLPFVLGDRQSPDTQGGRT
jgi:hypothetical protein